uniref:Uncharacterized protein TCIL3000_10_9330 n=1 Tax=Trypanosoma congolense (strain IL3000) TaxID=1068625 RepID=G0UXN8_TRYCI|nr:unnamed protein product [Trypanosoma congolense IL3000]
MPLCYSPSNAHQYVLLKFEKSAGREHQKKGSALLLLTLKALQQADAVCGAALPELAHVGVLSTVPFFSMRFGCRLAYAWVWDSAAWKSLSEGWRNNTLLACMNVGEEMTENSAVEARANKAGRCCFFVCAKDQVPAFSPYLSGPPEHSLAHVGPHRVCKRGRPSTMNSGKTWKEMELALYDINMCAPVELVRLSAPKAS